MHLPLEKQLPPCSGSQVLTKYSTSLEKPAKKLLFYKNWVRQDFKSAKSGHHHRRNGYALPAL
eukprot:426334-Amphidinium_carterae.1